MHKLGKASGLHASIGAMIVFGLHVDAKAESPRHRTLVVSSASTEADNYSTLPNHDVKFRQLFGNWQAMERVPDSQARAVVFSRAGDAVGRPVYPVRQNISGSGLLVALSTTRPTSRTSVSTSSNLRQQVPTGSVTSGFGMRRHPILGGYRAHNGIDLAAPMGTPIVASTDGVVQVAGWNGGYGNFVALDHGGGVQTRYGHMSRIDVVEGQAVRKGDVIGLIGSTGRSTGPHLHYEVRVNGQPVDPLSWSR